MFGRGTFGNRNVKKKMELKTLIINRETPPGGSDKNKTETNDSKTDHTL